MASYIYIYFQNRMKIGKILKNSLIFSENIYIPMKKVSFEQVVL